MSKAFSGRWFEDFSVGQTLTHAIPRTLHGGDVALYFALTGARPPLSSSTDFARSLGFYREVLPDLLVFHTVFGRSVPDISYNATANLGYADVRFLRPVYPGDTLVAESEVIGLRETSSGDQGIVYVRTKGSNQKGQEVLTFARWVMVAKRNPGPPGAKTPAPALPDHVAVDALPVPEAMNLQRFPDLRWATGSPHLWDDYAIGERIDHPGAMTIEEADHIQATRMYHNTAQVHFDAHGMASSRFGKRLIYGGHVISVAMALAQNGLGNALWMSAWNGGSHVSPTFAGDTIRCFTEVIDKAELGGRRDLGALRLRMVAAKNLDAAAMAQVTAPATGAKHASVVLELDYWTVMPRR